MAGRWRRRVRTRSHPATRLCEGRPWPATLPFMANPEKQPAQLLTEWLAKVRESPAVAEALKKANTYAAQMIGRLNDYLARFNAKK